MSINDEITEQSVSTPVFDGSVTAEDIAWVDSLLTKDSELLNSGWDSFKEALFETMDTQDDSSAPEKDNFSFGANIENPSSISETGDLPYSDNTEAEQQSEKSINSTADEFWSKYRKEDVFLPTYKEDLLNFEPTESTMDPLTYELLIEDIFKIWDLEIPSDEDNDLEEQFINVLAVDPLEPNASKAWKGLKDVSLDDLIAGISDLSLSPNAC